VIVFSYHRFFLGKIMYVRQNIGTSGSSQQLKILPDGASGIKKTLEYMHDFANEAKTMPIVRELSIRILQKVKNKDWIAELTAIQEWVMQNVRYTLDVDGVETLQRPDVTLTLSSGDCDDHSALVGAMLQSVGYPVRFVAIGEADDYQHVYCEAMIPTGQWFSVETTERVPVGWEPDHLVRMVV